MQTEGGAGLDLLAATKAGQKKRRAGIRRVFAF
jgi:hypothetical protein